MTLQRPRLSCSLYAVLPEDQDANLVQAAFPVRIAKVYASGLRGRQRAPFTLTFGL